MASSEKKAFLADKAYDNDAPIVDSDADTDNDDASPRPSDEHVLDEAEEQERLLAKPNRADVVRDIFAKSDQRDRRRRRRSRRKSETGFDEDGRVVFEMEGGFKDNSSESSVDLTRAEPYTPPKRGRMAVIHIVIIALFVLLAYGAWTASRQTTSASHLRTYWNGTHEFKPTTILISLDGFRADFLNRGITPALNAFIASGVSPRWMLPSFPSVTFPNHFTLVTGLYPESHGIVSNQFWDPEIQEEFYYTDTTISMQPKWWNAEPIWVTAEDQGAKTAIHMWPGSEAHIPDREPTYLDKFNESEVLPKKVDRLMHWLDLPGDEVEHGDKRPQLLLSYVPNVDADGHRYGPNSTEIRATIADVDSMLTMIVEGLVQRNLTEIVNLVVVSDHGMATTSTKRIIQLDELIDVSLIDHMDGWPLRGLRLKDAERDLEPLHQQLLAAAKKMGSFDVYTRETMPERYHFSNNDRIAPLWIVPKAGWAVLEKTDFDVAKALEDGTSYEPKGLHGYDHEHPLMRAIFVARGPAFPHPGNSRLATFQNTEVYNIVCESIGIKPGPNNGTLHLPLRPQGLHSDDKALQLDTPHDAPEDAETTDPPPGSGVQGDQQPGDPDPSTSEEGSPDSDTSGSGKKNWWKFLHDQLEKAKEWAKQFAEAIKGNKPDSGTTPT
ncbi:putative pyrophosphatase/phosphodiesterase [Cyphellophora attinorum]|uniref:Putative pyrophosphatase/phosphodiesterase n=1 Tax=Cyphellophora attinorum TaxID=1664694 RepID=A0A0N0NQ39_9EURO|nr:putative pyrophosphatase/phosphodiesterase [Phialophora attinorum]KPI43461.1 putative pyrophosphatase/phosphodiesterase [Phialophora attinorum]